MSREEFKIETQLVQGIGEFTEGQPRVYPIYQTTTYDYSNMHSSRTAVAISIHGCLLLLSQLRQ